jgi:predicted amidohydrolase
MLKARKENADIVHFPECALSGYASADFLNFGGFDWKLLKSETEKIMALAQRLKLWVVLGSTHRLTPPNKPHNCLYLIGPDGELVDRYDKRFCTTTDLKNYTPGSRFVNFTVKGVKCSLLICFDLRFPELYRKLRTFDIDCIFQSFYNARQKGPSVHTHIMRQTMQARAATNYFWISMSNASGLYSPYASCFIQPNGKIAKHLRQNRISYMINTVDLKKPFYDPTEPFRDLAIGGKLDNAAGALEDERSTNTKSL